jgi:hypothetical protein
LDGGVKGIGHKGTSLDCGWCAPFKWILRRTGKTGLNPEEDDEKRPIRNSGKSEEMKINLGGQSYLLFFYCGVKWKFQISRIINGHSVAGRWRQKHSIQGS